jgi:hypothetical protein
MKSMRTLALIMFAGLLCAFAPVAVAADEIPPYDGLMSFPAIEDPAGPEEFSWEVQLEEDEELRSIDDRRAGVYYVGEGEEFLAMPIQAQAAHDSEGKAVPTTLAVTQPNIITLTVHHRAGNPDAEGAPFDYPVTAGVGWEGGFQTHEGQIEQTPPPEVVAPSPGLTNVVCRPPNLIGKSLKASRKLLRKLNCKLGPVRGERGKGAKVAKQYRQRGRSLPAGSEVGVKLG